VSGAQVARLDYHEAPVRDCSWHPLYPTMISSSWDGDIAKWEFPGSGRQTRSKHRRCPWRKFY
jgi:WD repeat-containing protein 23